MNAQTLNYSESWRRSTARQTVSSSTDSNLCGALPSISESFSGNAAHRRTNDVVAIDQPLTPTRPVFTFLNAQHSPGDGANMHLFGGGPQMAGAGSAPQVDTPLLLPEVVDENGQTAGNPSDACTRRVVQLPPTTEGGDPTLILKDRSGSSYWKEQIVAFFQPSDNKLAMKLFGTRSALQKERRRQQQTGLWIIHPCSNFRCASAVGSVSIRFLPSHELYCTLQYSFFASCLAGAQVLLGHVHAGAAHREHARSARSDRCATYI